MRTITVLIILLIREILSAYLVYKGIEKRKNGDIEIVGWVE